MMYLEGYSLLLLGSRATRRVLRTRRRARKLQLAACKTLEKSRIDVAQCAAHALRR